MRPKNDSLEKYRQKSGPFGTDETWGMTGRFFIPPMPGQKPMCVLSSGAKNGTGWEHVSVSYPHRTPTWEEMNFIKDLFWGEDETVVQLHPPKSEYVNNHPYCLHLWKSVKGHELPPTILTGVK